MKPIQVFVGCLFLLSTAVSIAQPPAPYGVVPSARQLQWHKMETYGFVHFTINTFTGKEWGYGDEDPALFNPTDFNANQVVLSMKSAGMKGLILTCKHHDGFCLWPTRTTEHNITKSPWKNGKGDIVKEFADACKRHGLKFGVYLSPWDRNNKYYGTPEYVKIYRAQYAELLTQYGPVFETWHDGANGGDGYYGGARETRTIDRVNYYNWDSTWKMERQLQPSANIMSDIGWDVRWVGTEAGYAGDPCWHTYTPHGTEAGKNAGPGLVLSDEGLNGHRNGKYWIPAEVDFSIRPGWFFHEQENDKVKTAEQLLDHYFLSVGHGASMLLNVPPDKTGQVYAKDAAALKKFGELIKQLYATDHAKGAIAVASNTRAKDSRYGATKVLDNDRYSYWATDDTVTTGELTLQLKGKKTFNVILLRENIKLGQRIDDWAVDIWDAGNWKEYAKGTAIGSSRLIRGKYVTTDKIRVRITKAAASICLSEVGIYTEPRTELLSATEKKDGWLSLFDGKTLTGWRMYQDKPADCWGVKNGELYCKGSETDKSDLRADIITTKQYENFELSLEWKIAAQGNSGILYHVTEEYPAAYLSGPEYQLIDDIGFPQKLEDWQKTGADYAMYPASSPAAKPVGQYNLSKIVVKGAHREYWLNGVKVVEFEAGTDDWKQRKATGKWKDAPGYGIAAKGYICLQDHGSGVWFRNIKLKELNN